MNNQTQTPIPGAGHDYQHLLGEAVNFSNGSVSFKISFPVATGRGFSIPFAWSYNSGAVNPLDNIDGITPTWDDLSFHRWPEVDGWNLQEGTPLASAQVWQVNGNGINPFTHQVESAGTWIPCNFQSGMTFTDMQGVKHNLGVGAQSPAYFNNTGGYFQTCPGGSAFVTPPTGDGQVIATINPETASSDTNDHLPEGYLRSNSPHGLPPFSAYE